MKWVSMAEQPRTSLRSPPCAIPSRGWSVVKLAAIGLWSSGNTFFRVMNHTSPSGHLGLADTRRTLPARMHSANCKVWWRRNNGLWLFFMVQASLLSSREGKSQCYSIQWHSRRFCASNFVATVWGRPFAVFVKSNQMLFVTYTWLANVNACVAKCLCF